MSEFLHVQMKGLRFEEQPFVVLLVKHPRFGEEEIELKLGEWLELKATPDVSFEVQVLGEEP